MKPNGESRELVPINGQNLPHGFSRDIVTRALALAQMTRSVAEAHRALVEELGAEGADPVPDYKTMWEWVRASDDVIKSIQTDRKKELQAIVSDAAVVAGDRMLSALPNLPDSQVAVPFGIILQRATDLYSDRGGPVAAVQFNLVTRRKEED